MDYDKMTREELIDALKDSQEVNIKLLDLMDFHNSKMTQISIESLEIQIKLRHKFLAQLEETKPSKLFKSVYANYQKKIDEVKAEIEELDQKLYEEYTELGNYLEKKAKKNKDND